jgi:hypothetical protein
MSSRQWYCTECGQTFISSDASSCSLCRKSGGLIDAEDPIALRDFMQKKQASDIDINRVAERAVIYAILMRRIIRCLIGGVVSLLLAAFLLLNPDLRSDPHSISLWDFVIAAGPLLVGIVLVLVAFVSWREMKSLRGDSQ